MLETLPVMEPLMEILNLSQAVFEQ